MALTEESIRGHLANVSSVDVSAIQCDTPLFSSKLIDSFAMIDLIVFLEAEGGFRMGPFDITLENLDSIERMIAYATKQSGTG